MDITKKELREISIIVPETEDQTRKLTCRMIIDFIEGHINKKHLTEWAGLQQREKYYLQAVLDMAKKENIDKTISIIRNSRTPEEAALKLQQEYNWYWSFCLRVLNLPLSELTQIRYREEEYRKAIERRKILREASFSLWRAKDIY